MQLACGRIAERFQELGIKGVLPQSLIKQAREMLGQVVVTVTPEQAAEEFVRHLRTVQFGESSKAHDDDATAEMPVLVYFCEEFYIFEQTRWRVVPDAEFKAQVTLFLQQADHGNQVTSRFVGDVLANLKGVALLADRGLPLPLWIEDAPSRSEPSPYLSFANGLVHFDETMAGSAVLFEHDPRHVSTIALPYDFDPEARCPLWLETLEEILCPPPDGRGLLDRRLQVLQEFFGYTLLQGDVSYQKFLVLVGLGEREVHDHDDVDRIAWARQRKSRAAGSDW